MLSLRASSSTSRRRRSAAMSPMALPSAAALLLLRGVSGSNATTDANIQSSTPSQFRIFKTKFVANPPRSPLGLCEGDCDNDRQCADGLICHQRDKNEEVPGCTGGGSDSSLTDYCIQSNVDSSTSVVVASPTVQPSNVPTALPTPLPTTENPTAGPTQLPTTAEPTPLSTSANPTPLPTTANPTNLPTSLPTTAQPTPLPTTASPTPLPSTAKPTRLVTTTTASPTPLPTTAVTIQSPTPPTPLPTTAQPTSQPTQVRINRVGNNGSPQQDYPLELCQGDCDNDGECAGDLICHQREPFEAVPGCDGGESESEKTDYCIRPPVYTASPTVSASPTPLPTVSSAPTVSPAPSVQPSVSPTASPTIGASAPVRLRLYWQRDYRWQETSRETWWCMQCRSGACTSGSTIEVDHCSSSKRQKFQYYNDKTFRPMNNPDLCFEGNGWDRETDPIKLKKCNGSSRQKWNGFNEKKRFEIKSGRNSGYLLTQAHHPKAHERVFPQQSRRARNHKTSYWIVY